MADIDIEVGVTLTGDGDLKSVSDGVEEVGRKAGGATSGINQFQVQLDATLNNLRRVRDGLLRVVGAVASVADEFEFQAGIINRFSGDISEATERTNGLVSQLELIRASSRAAAAGIDLSGRDFANLAVAATEVGAKLGGASVSLDQLVTSIATGRTGPLRQLGIDLDGVSRTSDKVRTALEQLEEQYGDTESRADTFGGSVQLLRVAVDDFGTELIGTLNESEAFQLALKSVQVEVENLAQVLGFEDGQALWEAAMQTVIGFTVGAVRVVGELIEAIGNLISAAQGFAEGVQQIFSLDFASGAERLSAAFTDLGEALTAPARAIEAFELGVQGVLALGDGLGGFDPSDERTTTVVNPTGNGGGGGQERLSEEARLEAIAILQERLVELDQFEGQIASEAADREAEAILREIERISLLQERSDVVQATQAFLADIANQESANQEKINETLRSQIALRQALFIESQRSFAKEIEIATAVEAQRRAAIQAEFEAAAARKSAEEDVSRKKSDELAAQRDATIASLDAGVRFADQAGSQTLEAFGASAGVIEGFKAIIDFADAATAFARYDLLSGSAHLLAGGLHVSNAVRLGQAPPSGAAPPQPTQQLPPNTTPLAPSIGGGLGGGGNVTVNYNSPVPESQIGREQERARRDAARRFGRAA